MTTRVVDLIEDARHRLAEESGRQDAVVTRIPLVDVAGWDCHADAEAFTHHSGRFFSVIGLDVSTDHGLAWHQPIIDQPEVGILGLLVRRVGDEVHALVQMKIEPGNPSGLQLAPTVQATHSNYSRVHGGNAVPYLEYFLRLDPLPPAVRARGRVDALQSEIGGRFLTKMNRNLIVEVEGEVEALPGFFWTPMATLWAMHGQMDLVNMDLRSILSTLPADLAAGDGEPEVHEADEDIDPALSHWLSAGQSGGQLRSTRIPLARLDRWQIGTHAVSHVEGRFFEVIGVHVEATGREVRSWDQPMIEPRFPGHLHLVVTRVEGVLHALVRLHEESGSPTVEIGATVQCAPGNHGHLPADRWPPLLPEALDGRLGRVVFDGMLADEGGRFFHALNRHVVSVSGEAFPVPGFRWVRLAQLRGLARQGRAVTMELRSLLSCLAALPTLAPESVP